MISFAGYVVDHVWLEFVVSSRYPGAGGVVQLKIMYGELRGLLLERRGNASAVLFRCETVPSSLRWYPSSGGFNREILVDIRGFKY